MNEEKAGRTSVAQHDNAVPPRHGPVPASLRQHTSRINARPLKLLALLDPVLDALRAARPKVERPDREVVDRAREEGAEDEEVAADDGACREAQARRERRAGERGREGSCLERVRRRERRREEVEVATNLGEVEVGKEDEGFWVGCGRDSRVRQLDERLALIQAEGFLRAAFASYSSLRIIYDFV